MTEATTRVVRVWDPLVRLGHWALVAGFFIAYVTEDELLGVHVWAGYVVGSVVLLRVIWGFVGPQHARFSDFVCGPAKVFSYLLDLLLLRAPRYLGHSPGGGAMVIVLLVSLGGTVGTGLIVYGADRHAGPLAPFFAMAGNPGLARVVPAVADEGRAAPRDSRRRGPDTKVLEEVHEYFANLTLILIVLHIAGVGLASVVHRENLVRAMITGDKRALAATPGPEP